MLEFLLSPDSEEYYAIDESYGIDDQKKEEEVIISCRNAIQKIKENVDLFCDIKIVFVKNIGDRYLGMHRGQTFSEPIVMLSLNSLRASATENGHPLSLAIETTIYHAIGIAICKLERELDLDDKFLDFTNEDDYAEDFAYNLYYYEEVSDDLKRFIMEVHK